MSTLRVSDLPGLTGFSMRYWQRRVAAGHVPGCREVACGKRRVFLIDSAAFESQTCVNQGLVVCVGQTTNHGEFGPYKLWAVKKRNGE